MFRKSWVFASIALSFIIVTESVALPPVPDGKFVVKFNALQLSKLKSQYPALAKYSDQKIKEALLIDAGLYAKEELSSKGVVSVSTVSGKKLSSDQAQRILRLMRSNIVAWAEPDYLWEAVAVPNDPQYASLWGMNHALDADIDAPDAWDITSGSTDVVVGVVDTGVDYNHEDLRDNMWVNPGEIAGNSIDDDGNGIVDDVFGYNAIANSGNPMDDHYHGTHCAGTIGATGNNGKGVAGVNWQVKLLALKFLDKNGSGSTTNAVKAINYAVKLKKDGVISGPLVLSNSWGGGGFSQALEDAIKEAHKANILFVAAAGNAASNTDKTSNYPSNYNVENVVSVAALSSNGQLASFSNYGLSTVDLAAPGVSILSTTPSNKYSYLSGTSMATPHVAGAAAAVLSSEPNLTVVQLRTKLMDAVKPLTVLKTKVASGGTLSLYNALTIVPNLPPEFVSIDDLNIGLIPKTFSIDLAPYASDPEGKALKFSASIKNDYAQNTAFAIRSSYPSITHYPQYNNLGGMGEKYLYIGRKSGSKWIYNWAFITPTGVVYVYNGKCCYVATWTLSAKYHADPNLISKANKWVTPATVSLSGSVMTVKLLVTKDTQFDVVVGVTDDKRTVTQEFTITATNRAPTLANIPNAALMADVSAINPLVVPLDVTDADGNSLYITTKATAAQTWEYELHKRMGFYYGYISTTNKALKAKYSQLFKVAKSLFRTPYFSSVTTANNESVLARCFVAQGGRYCILSTTYEVFLMNTNGSKTFLGMVSPSVYNDPYTLSLKRSPYTASPATVSVISDEQGTELQIIPKPGFESSNFGVTVTVSDTLASVTKYFAVMPQN